MQRVMICGGPGSGKSTLARIIGQRTGLPVQHMDHIHWKSGWVARPQSEKIPMALAVIATDAWVFEGGHSTTYPERAARADTLIWLDLPFHLRLWRVFRRTWRYRGQTRPDLPDGCPEGFYWHTLEFWYWIWTTRHTSRVKVLALRDTPDLAFHHLTSPAQVEAFLCAHFPATDSVKEL